MKSFCCNKVVLSAIVLLHFYFSLATTVNRETLLPSSSTGLSVLQRPRKPHRYVSLASFSNLTDEKISFPRVGPDVLEVDYLSTKLDYCKVSDATVPPLPPSFFSGEALLFFKVMACFKVIDLNDRVRNLVVEMEQLLSDAFVIIKNLHQLKKKYNFKLTYCKRAWLKIKRNQKRFFQSSPLARTYNTHLIPSLSAMLVNADLNLLSVKQSEYLQSLEEKTRSSFELNRFMGKEIKELQSALYRTEVALRESSNEKKNKLEGELLLRKVHSSHPVRKVMDLGEIFNANSCIIIASRAQKYEEHTNAVIERLEGQLKNITIQLSTCPMSSLTDNATSRP